MKLSFCIQAATTLQPLDLEVITSQIEVLAAAGVDMREAERLAVDSAVDRVLADRRELAGLLEAQHPDLFVAEQPEAPEPEPYKSKFFTMPEDYQPRQARRIVRNGRQSIEDAVTPETPEYVGNMTGDLAIMPAVGTIKSKPIRLPVGAAYGPHKGFGIEHARDNADRYRRLPPNVTGDPAEDMARDIVSLMRSAAEIYQDANGDPVLRDGRRGQAIILEDRGTYYSVKTIRPAHSIVWGSMVARRKVSAPVAELLAPGQAVRYKFDMAGGDVRMAPVVPIKPRTPVVTTKTRRQLEVRQSRLAEDLPAQREWLTQQAAAMGYRDIDDLVDKDFDAFMDLAEKWREQNPAEVMQSRKAEPGPMYMSRPVENAQEILDWAGEQGIKDLVPTDKMHVTIAYSKAPVDSRKLPPPGPAMVEQGGRSVVQLGDEGAIVMMIQSPHLSNRWAQAMTAGASWDFKETRPAYKPHITLSYKAQDVDLKKVEPYTGPITLGDEKVEDLQSDWSKGLPKQARPPGGYVMPGFGNGDLFIEKIQDRYNRWKQVIAAVGEQGGIVNEANDFYKAEERYWGKVGTRVEAFDEGVQKFVEALAADKVDMRSMQLYAYAKHARERNNTLRKMREANPKTGFDSWSGMTDDDADAIISDAAQAGLTQVFEKHHATLMGWTQGTRDLMLDEGLITDVQYLTLNAAYDNYVPLKGKPGEEGKAKQGTGAGFSIRGKETERARGRYSEAGNIIEHIMQDRVRALTRAGKNEVLRSFLQFVLENPDPNSWQVNATEMRPIMRVDDQGNQIIEEDRVVIKDDRTIGIKDGGREVSVLLKDDKLLEQMKNMHIEQVGAVVGHLLSANRILSRLYTSLSPTFTVLNAARDLQAGTMGMIGEQGFAGAGRMLAALPRAVSQSFQAEFGQAPVEYQLYKATGGKTGFMDFKTIEQLAKDLEKRVTNADRAAVDPRVWAPQALSLIEKINGGIENSVRLASFIASREGGKTVAESASVAKNITVNFNRKGTWTPTLSAYFLFFNPAVQGTARILQSLKSPKVLATIGAGMAGMALLALQNASMGDDDDGVAWWDKISQETKDRNMIIVLPPGSKEGEAVPGSKIGRYLKIPMPYGYNWFATVANQVADRYRNSLDPARGVTLGRATKNVVSSFLGAYMPAQELARSIDTPKAALLAAVPDVINAPAQIALNLNQFGRPLFPETRQGENTADASKYFAGQAGTIFQRAAAGLNEATGGNPYKGGLLDFTPASLETLARAYGGGPASFALDLMNMAYVRQSIERPDLDVRRSPFVKQLYGQIDAESDRNLSYQRLDEVAAAVDPVTAARREGKGALARQMQDEAGPIYYVGGVAQAVREQLAVIRKQELQIIASDQPEAIKYARLQTLDERKRAAMQRVNVAYNAAMRKPAQQVP